MAIELTPSSPVSEMFELDRQNPQHRKLTRLVLARYDVQSAQDATEHIVNEITSQRDPLLEPLRCAAVISYSRPFIVTRYYPGLTKVYETFDSRDMQLLHRLIIEFRNAFIAHRDSELNQVLLIPKGSVLSWSGGSGTLTEHGDFVRSGYLPLSIFPPFRDLCSFQVARLERRIETEKERLFP